MHKILIEGHELAGKSTIAQMLSEKYRIMREKHIKPNSQSEIEESLDEMLRDLNSSAGGMALVDRFYYPSDMIYSPIYDGESSSINIDKGEIILGHDNLTLVILQADEDSIVERYNERGDEALNVEQCVDSLHRYRTFLSATDASFIKINTNNDKVEDTFKKVEEALLPILAANGSRMAKRMMAAKMLIESTGDDATRDGLLDTPNRVARMYDEIFAGYNEDPKEHLRKIFDKEPGDEIVLVRDIEFWSHCEHHMVPFFGKAHVAYIPKDGKVVGISKIARAVKGYARRLQIQERLTKQVADAMSEILDPIGVAVIIEADHLCMKMRGIKNPCANTVTSELRGAFKNVPAARQELFALIELRK